jgi:hypothetical protein
MLGGRQAHYIKNLTRSDPSLDGPIKGAGVMTGTTGEPDRGVPVSATSAPI